ncbi:MAG: hypothetical protein ACYDEA_01855 [Candidatus Dormibacteria bacterium]
MRHVLRLSLGFLVGAVLLSGCGQAAASVTPKAAARPAAAVSLHLSAGQPAFELLGNNEYAVVLTAKGEVKGGTYGLNGGTVPWQFLADTCTKDGAVVGGPCIMIVQGAIGSDRFTLQEGSKTSNTVVVNW